MKVKNIYFETISRPLKVLFSTSLGKKDTIKSVIVKVILDNKAIGIGECPTSFVSKFESIDAIKKVLYSAKKQLEDKPIENYKEEICFLKKKFSNFPMTISGLEVALFRAYLSAYDIDEHSFWGAKLSHIETDITIPFLTDFASLNTWLRYAIKKGFKEFKIKISGKVEQDIHIISTVHEILKESLERFTMRLDGNQGFNEKTFFKLHDLLEKKGISIQCFEQPLLKNDFSGMKAVKKYSNIPIILDETVFNINDLERVLTENICDGINIKIAKSGINESKNMIELAKKYNLKLMIGCMTETMVGLSSGIFMASGTGKFDFIDLDSIYYLNHKRNYGNIYLTPPFFFIKSVEDFSFLTKNQMNATH